MIGKEFKKSSKNAFTFAHDGAIINTSTNDPDRGAFRSREMIKMAATILSAKEVAAQLETDARTLRKFLRSDQSPIAPVGKGNRYQITAAEAKKMRKAFDAWHATEAEVKEAQAS